MKYYLAYGSNMNRQQMSFRCPDAEVFGKGYLNDYELFFAGRKNCAVASIRKAMGKKVPVVVWLISDNDEASLDIYEGYPRFYTKRKVPIKINGVFITPMVYIMTERPSSVLGTPSKEYYRTIRRGYYDFRFDNKYLDEGVERSSTSTALDIVTIARRQRSGEFIMCPRCGGPMKERLVTNALSRRADIYVCDDCGVAEAMADAYGAEDTVNMWHCMLNK